MNARGTLEQVTVDRADDCWTWIAITGLGRYQGRSATEEAAWVEALRAVEHLKEWAAQLREVPR